jgi:hypothetical protein
MTEEGKLHRELDDIMAASKELLETLTAVFSRLRWNQVEKLLKDRIPLHYTQLCYEPDENRCVHTHCWHIRKFSYLRA